MQIAQAASNNATNASASVVAGIAQASARTGVDFAYLFNQANRESGLNPAAKASGSSASGAFQFVSNTWLNMVKQHGAAYGLGKEAAAISVQGGTAKVADPALKQKILALRNDPVLSAAMAAEYTLDNKHQLAATVGGSIGSTELYLAHFLGAGGASTFLNALHATPHAEAAALLPQAADANPAVFYDKKGKALSLQAVYQTIAKSFAASPATVAAPSTIAAATPAMFPIPSNTTALMPLAQLNNNNPTSTTLLHAMLLAQNALGEALYQS